jgi:RimJ/RimL family protein N-acetyltransferase
LPDQDAHREPSPREFVDHHRPALARDEVRHNLLIAILNQLDANEQANIRRWTLGAAGACAVQGPPYPIVLGDLTREQCHALAEMTRAVDYPGVVGPDRTPEWFAERAATFGVVFGERVPQGILALREAPRYPGAPGSARPVEEQDAALLYEWTVAFIREAVQHDPLPSRAMVEKHIAERRHTFWTVNGEPVSMAAISRRLRDSAAISAVYTPPALRGRGYAGSAVAAVVECIFAEGRSTACLYVDLRNPFSNRCYAKVGFKPVCESWHYARTAERVA